MKNSMRDLCPRFNTNRMVKKYTEKFYLRAYEAHRRFSENGTEPIRAYQKWLEKINSQWNKVEILDVNSDSQATIPVGTPIKIQAKVALGTLEPDEVMVQAYIGRLDSERQITEATPVTMEVQGQGVNGVWEFSAITACRKSGRFGYSARVLPAHPELVNPFELGLIRWAKQ